MKTHAVQPVLLAPDEDIHQLLDLVSPHFEDLPRLAGIGLTFVPSKTSYDLLANPSLIVDDGPCTSGCPQASINHWSVLSEKDFDPAALYRLIQTASSFTRLSMFVDDLVEGLEAGEHPDITVAITRSCILIEHADVQALMMSEGFPSEEAIKDRGWVAHMLGAVAAGPAHSNHARIALAERVRADIARLYVADKGAHDIISRRFGVTLEIPTSTRIIAEAIGPERQYPA